MEGEGCPWSDDALGSGGCCVSVAMDEHWVRIEVGGYWMDMEVDVQ